MPGLRRDHNASAAAGDDIAELLQHERRAIQIDLEDRRRRGLRGGNTGGMDEAGDVADRRGRLDKRMHRLARGNIDGRGAHLDIPAFAQDFRRRIGVILAQISQQDVLAYADPPRDRLADLSPHR